MREHDFRVVDRDIVDLLLQLNSQQSAVELANLWGDIAFWSIQKKRRWSKNAYHLSFGTNQRTLGRWLDVLESIGAVTTDPVNRVALLPPWGMHESGEGGDMVSPLSNSNSNPIPIPLTTTLRGQAQKAMDEWNSHKPDTWKALQRWNPARQKAVDALYHGNGGMTQFIKDIPQVMAGLPFIGKKDAGSTSYWLDPEKKQHHNFDCFVGVDQKQPKSNWTKALEAAPDACATSDSLDTLETAIERMWYKHAHPKAVSMGILLKLSAYGCEVKRQEQWSDQTWDEKHAEAWLHFYETPFIPND